jgi:hypothetical protein
MYSLKDHPDAIYRAMDDDREYEVLCILAGLVAKARQRVPEWRPEMRETLHRQEASWGPEWYE